VWSILESDEVLRAVPKLQSELVKKYELWKSIVRVTGPMGLRPIRGFHDEALAGKWKGFRSSRLNKQYRVLYRFDRDEVTVYVVDVNAHDYRR
jgi:addiction module RelE/StbE family toxin